MVCGRNIMVEEIRAIIVARIEKGANVPDCKERAQRKRKLLMWEKGLN